MLYLCAAWQHRKIQTGRKSGWGNVEHPHEPEAK